MLSRTIAAYKTMRQEARTFASNESGVTSIEYALIGSLIAVAILLGVTNLGGAVKGVYDFVASAVGAVMP